MALESADDLKEYGLRKLGKPVINIELADEQITDCIDDAIQMFIQRHYDGVQEIYRKYTVTARDVQKGYMTVPEDVVAVIDMIDPVANGQTGSSVEAFERLNYRLAQSDIFDQINSGHGSGGSGIELTTYVLTMQAVNNMLDILSPSRNFYYNGVTRQLRTSGKLVEGNFIILHTYEAVDPETYFNAYDDEWLKKYTTALMKRQWGSNIKKYTGVQLPGGVEMNGQAIYDEAVAEIEKLEEQFSLRYEMPVDFFTAPSYL